MDNPNNGPLFAVREYSEEALVDFLSNERVADRAFIERKKSHTKYLHGYLGSPAIGAKTIVAEYGYIDRDFLEDFAAFHVRCFSDYHRRCTRLHFFCTEFTEEQFRSYLRNEDDSCGELLQGDGNYLGFIVVKPLPRTIIGRTCLRTYPEEQGREFPITRTYSVNLFGTSLVVDGTLAFQEQDSATAACASSALWAVFQGTGKLFHHHIPSPVEITKAALSKLPMEERDLPNLGLHDWQIAHAIHSVGLDPYRIKIKEGPNSTSFLQQVIYAYLKGGIPILLGVRLLGIPDEPNHAVAITGFKLGRECADSFERNGFKLRSSRMDKIYVHDDGVGPFARMEFLTDGGRTLFTTSWRDTAGQEGKVQAQPTVLLIPLYHKIRIPYESVLKSVVSFDKYVEEFRIDQILERKTPLFEDRVEWDIYLTMVNAVKSEIAESDDLDSEYREEVLLQRMPRFIWRATAYSKGKKALDLIYDATDVDQGSFFVRAIEYDLPSKCVLRTMAKGADLSDTPKTDPMWMALRWFAEQEEIC